MKRLKVSIADARNAFSQLVQSVEDGEPVEITRRGRSVAVLLAARDFERLVERPRTGFARAVRELRARYETGEMVGDSEEIFPRDPSPGRDFHYGD